MAASSVVMHCGHHAVFVSPVETSLTVKRGQIYRSDRCTIAFLECADTDYEATSSVRRHHKYVHVCFTGTRESPVSYTFHDPIRQWNSLVSYEYEPGRERQNWFPFVCDCPRVVTSGGRNDVIRHRSVHEYVTYEYW